MEAREEEGPALMSKKKNKSCCHIYESSSDDSDRNTYYNLVGISEDLYQMERRNSHWHLYIGSVFIALGIVNLVEAFKTYPYDGDS